MQVYLREGTSVRDKVNHLCGSQLWLLEYFLYAPQKASTEKQKKGMKTLNTQLTVYKS